MQLRVVDDWFAHNRCTLARQADALRGNVCCNTIFLGGSLENCPCPKALSTLRLPLGVPARLLREADALARRLLLAPTSRTAAAAGCEREAGYALLGALCLAQNPSLTQAPHVPCGDLLRLWEPALGASSAAQLDLTKHNPDPNPARADGEAVVAAEAWWRASALAALQVPRLSRRLQSLSRCAAPVALLCRCSLKPCLLCMHQSLLPVGYGRLPRDLHGIIVSV